MSDSSPTKILFLNRSYWPDAEATGQLLTELCEDLADQFDITVLAGQPNQNPLNETFVESGNETRNGVRIERVRNTKFAKRSLFGKLVNFLSFLWFAFWRTFRLQKQDVIVCETDPFLLPFLAIWLRFRHRAKLVFYLQDVYPDIAVAVGKAREGFLIRTLRRMLRWCYRRADRIVVLSDDMRDALRDWGKLDRLPIEIIPNWIDTRKVQSIKSQNRWRSEQNFDEKFVVMYSGNLGLSQDLEIVIDAAAQLTDLDKLLFVLIGDGASKAALEDQAKSLGLKNVRFLPYQPKERLQESLSAADLHLLPIRAAALRCLMPSKLYGILASGTAVLSTAPPETELARVVVEEEVGINVFPFTGEALAHAIRNCCESDLNLREMGQKARKLAIGKYDRSISVAAMQQLLHDLFNRKNPQSSTAACSVEQPESLVPVSSAQ